MRVQESDLTDAGAAEALIASLSTLDVLIVCVGISRDRDEYDLDTFVRVLDVNLVSGMRLCELARPLLRDTAGSIGLTSSMYSVFGAADRPAYGASKGAVNQLTRSLAVEYAVDGIRVNAVAPGWIETPLSAGLRADATANRTVLARMPIGRWGLSAGGRRRLRLPGLAGGSLRDGSGAAGRRRLSLRVTGPSGRRPEPAGTWVRGSEYSGHAMATRLTWQPVRSTHPMLSSARRCRPADALSTGLVAVAPSPG